MCSLVLLAVSLQLVVSYIVIDFHLCCCLCFFFPFVVLQKSCQWNFRDPASIGLAFLKKIVTPKWKHKLVWENKRGKLVSYFLDNAAKTCLYGSKISENIEIKHVFQPKAFFLLSNNLHTSQLSAFKASQIRLKKDVFFVTYLRCFNHISKRCLFCDVPETPPKISCKYYVTWEEDRFKCTIQITTHNTTQLFGQFDWKVECSFTN